MLKITGIIMAVILALPCSGAVVRAENTSEANETPDLSRPYVEDEVIVLFEEDASSSEIEEVKESVSSNDIEDSNFLVIDLNEEMSVAEAIDYYNNLDGVAYVQPNYIYELEDEEDECEVAYDAYGAWDEIESEFGSSSEATKDTYASNQWYISYLDMENTWYIMEQVPTEKVLVVTIDSGVDTTHPDLQEAIVKEYCVNTSTTDISTYTADAGSHGTHVAGIIAATKNNNIGVAGIASGYVRFATIQACKRTGGSTSMSSSSIARSIDYAVSIGARVINMSLGYYGTTGDKAMEEALERAYAADIVCVCSAGNKGGTASHFPSQFSTTIGIINTDKTSKKYSGSNYGPLNFMSAPGTSIYNTIPVGTYGSKGGTSMASAVVSGVVADILAVNPALTVEEVKTILAETATDIYSTGFDEMSGWGIVNPENAVLRAAVMAGYNPDHSSKSSYSGGSFLTDPGSVDSFVRRLYYCCLGRYGDTDGIKNWKNQLSAKTLNGGEAAYGFLFSPEFLNKNLSDEAYVEVLYRTFMGRDADPSGKAFWVSVLQSGMSRLYVMNGFSDSEEFKRICNNCGIQAGRKESTESRDQNLGATSFVSRLYTCSLGRSFDPNGLNLWTEVLLNGSWTPFQVSTDGFFHSTEFMNKDLSDEEFIAVLYRTFLGREADSSGFSTWKAQLSNGATRDQVIYGFAASNEFKNIMAQYGL